MGFVLFAALMLYFVFVCAPMQTAWGIWGLVATELSFLVIAIVYGLIFRIPLKEMFPIKKFSARDLFGSIFLVIGGTLIGLISVAVVGILIPSSVEGSDVEALTDFIVDGPGYLLTMIILALCPAICEEAIHRGAILSNFRTIRKDWVIVLIMAVFFGINHMSVLRFINTAILGACLSYVVVKKNNILLSSIMHFTVNFSASTISYLSTVMLKSIAGGNFSGSDISSQFNSGSLRNVLGTYLMIGCIAPILIVLGLMMLNPQGHKKIRFLFAGIIAAAMFVGSIGYTAYNTNANTLVQCSFNYTVTQDNSESLPVDLDIEKDGDYNIVCVLMKGSGDYFVKIVDENGEVIYQEPFPEGSIRTYTSRKTFEAGYYELYIVNGKGTVGDMPAISIQVNKA